LQRRRQRRCEDLGGNKAKQGFSSVSVLAPYVNEKKKEISRFVTRMQLG
jgi:hypothetical protein